MLAAAAMLAHANQADVELAVNQVKLMLACQPAVKGTVSVAS